MTDLETTGFWATLFVVSDWAIRLAMLPIVPTRRSPEAAKGWLLFIFFLPWLGLVLYLLIGRPRVPRWRTERFRRFMRVIEPVRQKMRALPLLAPPAITPQYEPSVQLATDLGMLPNFGGNAVELMTDYAGTLAKM
jgi:cardiolipin synthase A/B